MKFALLSLLLFSCNSSHSQAPQTYTTFQGTVVNLYKWEGNKVMLLGPSGLNETAMANWAAAMGGAYNYYAMCTGREPQYYPGVTYINNLTTIASVPATCGAGCAYLGTTGIELQDDWFANMYTRILNDNQYDQIPFYEFGRNFWFYDSKLRYLANDPIVTGYAVFMRFMSMEYTGVNGAPFDGTLPFNSFTAQVRGLLATYLDSNSLNWDNTLGIGAGVPGSGWGATDLFASFCFYLKEHYGGHAWVQNVWKYAALRPDAATTQDAVDNFIIAASQAAGANLTALFQSWRWPVSVTAINTLASLFSATPVKLVYFGAAAKDCYTAVLNWETTHEINNKGFSVEYSSDGNVFSSVGFVAANGTSGVDQYYSFLYNYLLPGKNYFRLRQMDMDNTITLSQVVSINSNCATGTVVVYPNPATNVLHIKGIAGNANTIQIINAFGATIFKQANAGQRDISISGWPGSCYILLVNGKSYKFIKK